ncbi:MAG: small multi-drug export protein [Candidatus Hydrogenedentes bacterium]|nr:small multi-drug export protein [Candidatus Hydrogenedentota bacterium]
MNNPTVNPPSSEPSPATLRTLLNLGHLSAAVMLVVWAVLFLLQGAPYEHTWQIILLTIFFGRAAAVGTGLKLGFGPFFLFYQAVIADIFIMLYIYPLFVRNYHHLTRVPYIGGYLDNLHKVALGYKTRVARYGIPGLMLFIIFPFWSTGVLVGSIVGYLIGLPAIATIVSITLGNTLAIGAWVWFYDSLNDWNESASLVLLILLFTLAIGAFLFARIRRKKTVPDEITTEKTPSEK